MVRIIAGRAFVSRMIPVIPVIAWAAVAAAALVAAGPLSSCLPTFGGDAPVGQPYSDDFEGGVLNAPWRSQGGSWRIVPVEGGHAVSSIGDHNIPLGLDVPLSRNCRVEFDAWSDSSDVDIKMEIFGDGIRHESGYIVIAGGWNNTLTVIARLDEHQPGRATKKARFEPRRRMHFVVERADGHTLTLDIDGRRILSYDDDAPLYGPRNNKLAFSAWESQVSYDNVVITPLP